MLKSNKEYEEMVRGIEKEIENFKEEQTILSLANVFEKYLDWLNELYPILRGNQSTVGSNIHDCHLRLEKLIEYDLKDYCKNLRYANEKIHEELFYETIERANWR